MPLFGMALAMCGVIALALCLGGILIRTCLVVITVRGQSMSPTLEHGDRVVVLRSFLASWIRKGQIVLVWPAPVVEVPKLLSVSSYIKRVTALAGEIYVTSSPYTWKTEHSFEPRRGNTPGEQTWHIPQNHIFVCGDNHEKSVDSRSWGPLPLQSVLGIVVAKLPRKSASSSSQETATLGPGLPAGQVAPSFAAPALSGETVTLSTYQGQNLLLIFIAATNLSRKSIPSYLALVPGAAADQTRVIFVSGDDFQTTHMLADELQITVPVLIAPHEKNLFLRDYNISSTPSYCLINAEGRVQSSGRTTNSLLEWKRLTMAWSAEQDNESISHGGP